MFWAIAMHVRNGSKIRKFWDTFMKALCLGEYFEFLVKKLSGFGQHADVIETLNPSTYEK
jgi:hypothetical protein